MKLLKCICISIILTFSFIANAKYYVFYAGDLPHPLGDDNTITGWDYTQRVEVNKVKLQWDTADVLHIIGINGNGTKYYNAAGNFIPATSTQITYAKNQGEVVLRSEPNLPDEDEEDCEDGPDGTESECTCPIVIDLGQDGIHFGDAGVGVNFDLLNNGQPKLMQWVKANENDAFLVWDANGNGVVDNGSELFGSGSTLLNSGVKAANGYEALGQFDLEELGGNNDGFITSADNVWSSLSLWLDLNADGISTVEEMLSLEEFEISTLAVTPKVNNRHDSSGNWLPYWSWATSDQQNGNKKYKMVDVFFKPL
ncbi:hypothetical protein [Thalassomonas actiniarum]|uniref:Calcium-binding protein n=1 Tax=Thalassomonas actiniarum TaxID=485447 RepID=A0AAF0C3A7_9GAMM|nr:hypothetical protein [Thalassomonas actiniarum]WDE01002.1 hypothetical protein SG35_010420 [Thalassomonas actiniarum]